MIRFECVSKAYRKAGAPPVWAVKNLNLEIRTGETLCLIGTSGCGKTTTLRLINRLIECTSGEVFLDHQPVQKINVIKLRRQIGYVTQKGGLFPHLNVFENIALLCRLEGWPEQKIHEQVQDLMERVNLPFDAFSKRYPHELSGGQRQRVGIARALSLNPRYILMDEPFGALDPITREGMHSEFEGLARQMRKTVVIVTHDLDEAFRLGDRVALMHEGKLLQVGRLEDFQNDPQSAFVSEFLRNHRS